MNPLSKKLMRTWATAGPRFLPFADAATPELPLGQLLRLSLFQVSVGMALVLLVGTLNRVMIVELGVPASLVAVMISLPVLFAPFRALVGYKSDNHQSALGWRRVGAGLHITQTAGLALATDLAPEESHPRVVGLMYVMLLFGSIVSALLFGALLQEFSPGRLIQVIQGSAVATIAMNMLALWKQELRRPMRGAHVVKAAPSFRDSWGSFANGNGARRRLLAVGLGTMAFSTQDVLLEPYGGEILKLSVSATTVLTATLAMGGLMGFWVASRVLSNGADAFRISSHGALCGVAAFVAVIAAAALQSNALFGVGVMLIGVGGGLFGHGTLTATMNLAPKDQAGLALGAWGAVQATAAGVAVAFGGIGRDVVQSMADAHVLPTRWSGPASGYIAVYSLEVLLLLATLAAMAPLIRRRGQPGTAQGTTADSTADSTAE